MQTQNLKKKKKEVSYKSLTFNAIEQMKTENKTFFVAKILRVNWIFSLIFFCFLSRHLIQKTASLW